MKLPAVPLKAGQGVQAKANQLSKLLSGPIKTSGNIDRGILDENK